MTLLLKPCGRGNWNVWRLLVPDCAGPADMHLVGDVITLALSRCVHTRFRIAGVIA